jgi:NTE family protein
VTAKARRPQIGLALGSGAARGWAHVGVIDALHEAGVEPDIVCGTSMGALVGAAYVADRLPALTQFAQALGWRQVVGLLDVRLSGGGLVDGARIVALLSELGIAAPIESYSKPYAAIATDLETGAEVWLREGPIQEVVRASISLPGIFSPAKIDDQLLVDGGLVNPVPVSVCRALGADVIIAVNLNGEIVRPFGQGGRPRLRAPSIGVSPEFLNRLISQMPAGIRDQVASIAPNLLQPPPASPGYFDVLMNSINIMQDQITRARLAGEPPHVLLVPRLRTIGLLEFNRAEECIAEGRACVEQALSTIRRYL